MKGLLKTKTVFTSLTQKNQATSYKMVTRKRLHFSWILISCLKLKLLQLTKFAGYKIQRQSLISLIVDITTLNDATKRAGCKPSPAPFLGFLLPVLHSLLLPPSFPSFPTLVLRSSHYLLPSPFYPSHSLALSLLS